MNILFICRGNVARSQIAEEYFNALKKHDKDIAVSTGTKLSGPDQTIASLRPKTDIPIAVMKEEGLDISENVRKEVSRKMVNNADKIVLILKPDEPTPDYIFDHDNVTRWEINDPKGKDEPATRKIRDQIKSHIQKLIARL